MSSEIISDSAGNALFSVYDKNGRNDSERVEVFAAGLVDLGWNIYASGGTHKRLTEEAGLPAIDVAELIGGGAILDHKVVTLSREIAAGLLSDPSDEKEMAEMKELGLPIIHLICQDSYPLEEEIYREGSTPQSVLRQTDIGGPTMLREGAKVARIFGSADEQRELALRGLKGGRIVLSVPEQRQQVLEWLRAGRPDEAEFLADLAARATYEVARYSMLEAKYWMGSKMSGHIALKAANTKYGENPQHADSAFYADNRVNIDPLGLDQFKHAKGWELSFVNLTDIDRLVQTTTHIAAGFERNFGEVPPMAVGVKHGNACGAGVGETRKEAVEKMLEGDTRAIFGGVVMINGVIDKEIAETLMHHAMDGENNRLLDGVVGSEVTDEALEILTREKLRVVINPALAALSEASLDTSRRERKVRGGYLEQPNYDFVQDLSAAHMEFFGPELTEQQKRDMILAWAIGCTSNSNTITLVKNGKLIGNGVGQQDRVGAGQLALSRTTIDLPHIDEVEDRLSLTVQLDREKLEGAVAYSDSFFPYPDGPQLLIDAGIKAILTSSGSTIGDKPFNELVVARGVSAAMVPDKVGRGFYAH